MATAHVYCRVSSAGQEDGYSLDTQERACREYAKQRGLVVASVAREVWSGADRHRPELDAMLSRLDADDVFIVYALDRLSRQQIDTALLIDRIETAGASLQLVTEDFEKSATGTFLRGAKAFAAELELEKIRERTQRGRRERVASGKPLAGTKPPYGYQWVDPDKKAGDKRGGKTRLQLDPPTAPNVRLIFDLALAGSSLRAISAQLAERGILSPNGGARWTPTGVRHILTRPIYTGTGIAYRERFDRKPGGGYSRRYAEPEETFAIPDLAPAIVTVEEQAAVLARLGDNKEHATRNNKDPEATLLRAGFIRCAYCGRALGVKNPPRTRPTASPVYRCNTVGCQHPSIAASVVDSVVWQRVEAVLRDPGIITAEVERQRREGGLERDLASLDRQLVAVADKQTRLARRVALIDDDDAAAPLIAELRSLAALKAAATAERDRMMRRITHQEEEDARVKTLTDWCAQTNRTIDTLTHEERRWALLALGVQVRVWRPDGETGDIWQRIALDMEPEAIESTSAALHPVVLRTTD